MVSILIDNWPCSIDTYQYFIISILPITLRVFSNGINSFLKAERAMVINISVSTQQIVTKINETVSGNCRTNTWVIVESIKAAKETNRKILHGELNMKKVCAKLVPKTDPRPKAPPKIPPSSCLIVK